MVKFKPTQKKQVQVSLPIWVIHAFEKEAKAHGITKTTDAIVQALEQLADEMEKQQTA